MSLLLLSLVFFLALPSWITIFRNLTLDTYFWQTKEYRIDRVISQIKYREGSNYRNLFFTLAKLVVFINLVIFYYYPEASYLLISAAILFLIHFIESELFLRETFNSRIPRPRLRSSRNMLIIGASSLFILLPYLLFSFWLIGLPVGDSTLHNISSSFQPVTKLTEVSFVEILPQVEDGILIIPLGSLIVLVISLFNVSLDLLTPLFVSTFSIITEPMALFKRRNMVQMAASKLRNLKDLKVIAITGSYGKTTTKELLFQILSNKFITAKTPENHNTDVGIAQAITNFVNEDTEVFIAEMGAYKKGEIMKSTKVAPPDISIVTGVEGQHLSIFGTIENVFEAKYEIIQGMKDDGLAILNGNNEYAVRMAERTDKEKIMYYSINEELDLMTATSEEDDDDEKKVSFPKNANIYAKDITFGKKGLEFTLVLKGTEYSIKTNIPGLHNASNLLAAIAVGLRLGIQPNELVEIINETNFDVPYLKTVTGINESKIIDDGYNVSPTGFLSGLLMLSKQTVKGKHWVLTQGLIELGTDREKVYKRLAKELVKKADGLITSDEDLHVDVLEADSNFNSVLVDTPYKLKNAYIEQVNSGDLVLIEGSLPGVVLSAIKTMKDE